MSKNKYIISTLAILLTSILIFFFAPDEECRILLEVLYVIENIYIIYAVKKIHNEYVNGLTIFLFSIFFFNGIRIILDLFGFENICQLDSPFSTETINAFDNNRALLNVIISIYGIALGYSLYKGNINSLKSKFRISLRGPIVWSLLIIGFAAKIYIAYESFSVLSLMSYAETYTEGNKIGGLLRAISYAPILIGLMKISERRRAWLWVIVIWALLNMAGGQRGPGLLLIISILYFAAKLSLFTITRVKVVAGIVIAITLSILVGEIRSESLVKEDANNPVMDFLWEEGSSFSVLQLTIKNEAKLKYEPADLVGGITGLIYHYLPFLSPPHYKESTDALVYQATQIKNWSSYISYMTNSSVYFLGGGMGGNYIGQLYAVGKELWVFIFSLIIGYFLHFINYKMWSQNIIVSYSAFTFFQSLIYIPRDNIFDFVLDFMPSIILITIVLILFISHNLLEGYSTFQLHKRTNV